MPRPSPQWPPKTLPRIPLGFVPRPPDHVLHLTEEQIDVVRRLALAERAILEGATGSGKTHLAVALAIGCAKLGWRVLVVSPRKPLAIWLQLSLHPYGVSVQTIDGCARSALQSQKAGTPARRGFDDPEFFLAAAAASTGGKFDLVIGEEWQTTTASEQHFIRALVGGARFIEVQDSSRDLRDVPPPVTDRPEVLTLTESLRSPDRVGRLDVAYSHDGLDPLPSSLSAASVEVTPTDSPEAAQRAVLAAVEAFRRRGFAPREVGVASLAGRAQSGLTMALCTSSAAVRAFQLTETPSMTGLACDSFSYWLGLERRGIVVVESPAEAIRRRTRLHIALSRACEAVHFVLPRADLESDEVLSAWLRASGEFQG